jgi:hypothetical protein
VSIRSYVDELLDRINVESLDIICSHD